ncbi:hypothetical protein GGR22_001552 [Flavobacterium gossypii]|uniref:TerB family tellurite resistance protein n=1 Tax=Flavobacterium gossypii TaxID=1646119 RepID=A0ABR6DP03_9FLAO|nr:MULTISPECIES: hypothetical protein [Flavobacterium]MBA9073426.1 hypothetical protein [Flavobacterium gossypii]WDO13881.1 hypothetical protein MH928_04085 [Flavobacterium sp. WW92]
MLTKGLRDEENERINTILKQLISLTYIPENWNLDELDNQLKHLALTFESLSSFSSDELIQHLEKFHFDWTNAEQFADFLVLLSARAEESKIGLKEKAVAVYEYIQKESKTFSFDIFNKITAAKA